MHLAAIFTAACFCSMVKACIIHYFLCFALPFVCSYIMSDKWMSLADTSPVGLSYGGISNHCVQIILHRVLEKLMSSEAVHVWQSEILKDGQCCLRDKTCVCAIVCVFVCYCRSFQLSVTVLVSCPTRILTVLIKLFQIRLRRCSGTRLLLFSLLSHTWMARQGGVGGGASCISLIPASISDSFPFNFYSPLE